MTTLVDRLKRDGLVRTECDERQRSVNIILTDEGRNVLSQAMRVAVEVANQVMLSIGEADALWQIIIKVVRAFVDGGDVILYNVCMSTEEVRFVAFLRELMRRRKCLPSQLAADLGVSHATVSRWFSGEDIPSTRSCQKLAEYSGVPLQSILSLSGHLPSVSEVGPAEWPEFRDYARQKYPNELDEDLITMIEDLIERRRRKRYDSGNKKGS